MALHAGKLRHKVTIQEQAQSVDPLTGDVTTSWRDLFTDVWASVEPLSVRDLIAAGAERSDVTLRVTIRWREIPEGSRILHGSKIYVPKGFLPDKESGREFLVMPCSSGPSQGL